MAGRTVQREGARCSRSPRVPEVEDGEADDVVYRRTQVGTVTVLAVGAAVVLIVALSAQTGWHPVAVAVLVLLVAALAMFCCLTIEIDRRQLRCFFGPGLIRRTIAVHEIVSAQPVRNRWYYAGASG